jgi:S-formylglutathione hydrolase FrmB
MVSPARDAHVELITMRPAGVGGRLPTCVALHGRASTARMFLDLGVPDLLNETVSQGAKPFAVVAVDGGDSYWVSRTPTDDPQKMLTDDLPTWLANRGFQAPFAAFGISMGGYGALNYARTPGLTAVATMSAALFTSWADAKSRNAFADEARWEETEPLRHIDELHGTQLGVWCGSSDPFIAADRQLITKASPKVAAITPGAHDSTYWKRSMPEVLNFVGSVVP